MNYEKTKVGIISVCVGKYNIFLETYLNSFKDYFLKDCEKHFYIFTDVEDEVINKYQNDGFNITKIKIDKKGWPYDTLYRFKYICENKHMFKDEYLIFTNINLKCQSLILSEEILPEKKGIVSTSHPGYYNKPKNTYPYETRQISEAFTDVKKGLGYYQGCLYGGSHDEFIKMCEVLDNRTTIDEKKDVIALWHDESHLNKYLSDNPPVKVLRHVYIFPESWRCNPSIIKMIQLDKNKYGGHEFLRS